MNTTRRRFLQSIVVAAGTIAVAGGPLAAGLGSGGRRSRTFPQGIASGDPKPDSVVLWTRVVDAVAGDTPLRLQVATERGFGAGSLTVDVELIAMAQNNRCLRAKITGLDPRTYYYYRFVTSGGQSSPIGRTRTAPLPQDDVPIRFAFASCQDYVGRWYNSYLPLLAPENDDLDFLVHLGDFIYETTGDPSFQSTGGPRTIRFEDEAGAIPLGDPANPFFAARTLSNYRQLHRKYRSDEVLQQVLAKFPLIAIWDDHEFTDDSWRDHGTFFDGRRSEQDRQRLLAAERAWLEYMPIDDTANGAAPEDILDTSADRLFPNIRIWRGLRFGKAVNLTLTDYRSFRGDHLIPEDAFPGAVLATEPELRALYARIGRDIALDLPELQPYLPFAALPPTLQAVLTQILTQEYALAGFDGDPAAKAAQVLNGIVSVPFLNRRLAFVGVAPLPTDGLPRGLTYELLGKIALFSELGSRYAVLQKWFDLYTLLRTPQSEQTWGRAQGAFVRANVAAGADAHWNVVANSTSNTSMIIDLAQDFSRAPEFATLSPVLQLVFNLIQSSPLGTRITLNVDQWDGFPLTRDRLLRHYRSVGNVVLIAGDIHSSWVTDHSGRDGPLFEFTGCAISSSSFALLIMNALVTTAATLGLPQSLVAQIPALLPDLVKALDTFLVDRRPASPFRSADQQIAFVDTERNGIVIVDADGEAFRSTYWLLPSSAVLTRAYDDPTALGRFETKIFEIRSGVLSEA